MCGIVGFFDVRGIDAEDGARVAVRMSSAIQHRGPDDAGVWVDPVVGIALGHRRLSIVDLSVAGHQPMVSHSGRFVIAFNGEVYNHADLRSELGAMGMSGPWRGHSDTETILEAISAWGIEKTIAKTVGMFAFALWDKRERCLVLVRDRLGEKPLYYGWAGSVLIFGSELKALTVHPSFRGHIDRSVLALYTQYNYIPSPWTIYEGIRKLPAGTSISFSSNSASKRAEPKAYWSAREVAIRGMAKPFCGDIEEAQEELLRLLQQSIAGQARADVPVAAFLSGGIDSSIVVAVMQSLSSTRIRSFSVGFHEDSHNEADYAKQVARHLGTNHTELYVSPRQALDVVPTLPDLFDEPFGDSSQIPTYLITSLTRQHVTVALSGDGGDELFGGYSRYGWADNLWKWIGPLPRPVRQVAAKSIRSISTNVWDVLFQTLKFMIPSGLRYSNSGDKLHKLARVLESRDAAVIYRQLMSQRWPKSIVKGQAIEPATNLTDEAMWLREATLLERMMFLDLATYLPDDILVKVDRAAMGASLETRVPLLDHRIVEFAWQLPLRMKVRAGEGKYILKQLLYRLVPKALVDRPKMGFGVPIDSWLRGPLREWAEALLSQDVLERQGYFESKVIRLRWQQHLSGVANWHYDLWGILMFQAWLERWATRPSTSESVNRAPGEISVEGAA